MSAKKLIEKLVSMADIEINGQRPWDIEVHDDRFYNAILRYKSLGLGESYMAGWWDCAELDQCIERLIKANIEVQLKDRPMFKLRILAHWLFNFQTKERARQVAECHYDIGNDLFQCMLDEYMVYSCGYWENAQDLNEAQRNKLALVCNKLQLAPGMRLLDIGCGWGGFAKYAAEHYGVEVVGITISKEQARLAKTRCAGLPIQIYVQDYRDLQGKFDRVASLGMFEHVGEKNYRTFMQVAKNCLNPDGLFLLHTIGKGPFALTNRNEWMNKYIFPNGELPSIDQLGRSWEGIFIMEDWHNFGSHYHQTLKHWHDNFNHHWSKLKNQYGESFRRMWNYYLMTSAGAAKARDIQLWQIVLSSGIDGGYKSVR
jgi:cyclopropane-fatty-acyl-phospholipid synthase